MNGDPKSLAQESEKPGRMAETIREPLAASSPPPPGDEPRDELRDDPDDGVQPDGAAPHRAAEADAGGPADAPAVEQPATEGPVEQTSVEQTSVELPEEEPVSMEWYILKVQSNRENSIAEALRRRVSIEGMEPYFGDIIVPTEKVTEFKGGKKRVVRRKLYPGYILVHMAINDDSWFLVRETPGIGDFTGAGGKPTPMLAHEVQRIVTKQEEKTDEAPKLRIGFKVDDRVKINEGTFQNFEGEVSALDEASGRVTVMINIFGRSTPVELEYWQVELV